MDNIDPGKLEELMAKASIRGRAADRLRAANEEPDKASGDQAKGHGAARQPDIGVESF